MSDIDKLRTQIRGARIYIIPYSHSDWAWTYTRQWHEERYSMVFKEVLEIMRRNPDYRWYFDTENEQLTPFQKRHPELMDELRQRVKEGRIGIAGGTITNPHPHRVGGEILIRNFTMGRRYFEREFPGADLSVLTLNDVIYGHSQLPQIATKCGYKYYWGTRPQCLGERSIPRQFAWRSPDGSRLLCAHGQYGSRLSSRDYLDVSWEEGAADFIETDLLPALKESPTGAVWVARGADDIRPLRDLREKPVDAIGFVERWNENESAPARFAIPLDYFQDVDKQIDSVPVIEGPVDAVGWSYWYGQIGNESLRTWRLKVEEQLLTAEKLATVCTTQLGAPYPQQFEQLWHDLLAACPHATLWLFAEDYDEMLWKLKSTCAAAKKRIDESVERLMTTAATTAQEECLIAINPESWERQALVKLHKVFPARGCRSLQIRNAKGEEVAHQLIDPVPYEDGTLKEADLLIHASTPALGYASFYVSELPAGSPIQELKPRSLTTLENERVSLRFDAGRLVSLEDKQTGRSLFDAGDHTIGDLRFHIIEDTGPYHYGPIIDTLTFACEEATLVEEGELRSRARLSGRIGDHRVEQEIAIHRTTRRIDFNVTIESAGGDGLFRVYFPFAYDGRIKVDIPFGVEERDVTREQYGSLERLRENVFYGSNWADYSTTDYGCALLIEPGMQGFCHFPDQRLLGHTLLKTIAHPTEGWERFETRLREGRGTQQFRYALLPHEGDWATAEVDRESVEFRTPLRGRWKLAPSAAHELGETESFLSCAADNVAVSSLYIEGNSVVLRLFETRGRAADNVELRLPFSPAAASKTDCLLRELEDPISVEGNTLRYSLSPWEIATFVIERGRETS